MTNLIVNPKRNVQDYYTPPPIGLLYLAAMDPDTVIYDAAVKGEPYDYMQETRPKIVGATCYTAQRHDSLNVLRAAKAQGAITVIGGIHVALMTDQLVEHYSNFIDYFVIGDGELAWQAICDDQRRPGLPRVIKMPVDDINSLPLPKWDAINIYDYPPRGGPVYRGVNLSAEPRVSVILTRGCTGRCTFCVPAGTTVSLPNGHDIPIETLKPGDQVLTVNGEGIVSETFERTASELIEIQTASGRIQSLTPEHPVLTRNRGWVIAADLIEGDDVIEIDEAC